MIEKICFCGHLEKKHGGLDETIEKRIQKHVNSGVLTPHYYPDRAEADYSFSGEGDNGKVYTHQAVVDIIVNLRENYSSCKVKNLFGNCVCQRFQADNLRTLEIEYERKTSQVIK